MIRSIVGYTLSMEPIEILGIASAILALTAFIGNEYGKMSTESFVYDLLNFIAGLGLVIYAAHIGALPFMITNSVWALVSGFDVVKYLWKRPMSGDSI
jgi:hypothetical protein